MKMGFLVPAEVFGLSQLMTNCAGLLMSITQSVLFYGEEVWADAPSVFASVNVASTKTVTFGNFVCQPRGMIPVVLLDKEGKAIVRKKKQGMSLLLKNGNAHNKNVNSLGKMRQEDCAAVGRVSSLTCTRLGRHDFLIKCSAMRF